MLNKPVDDTKPIDTQHFYLQSKHSYYLKINLNGMQKALSTETLGEQMSYFTKPLPFILQRSKVIPSIDVIITKKYPLFYLEDTKSTEQGHKRKRLIRSRKSMERLRTLRMVNIEEQFQREFEKQFPNQSGD